MSDIGLSLTRGNDASYKVTIRDANNLPVDLTGASLMFTAKKLPSDTEGQAVIAKALTIAVDQVTNKGQATLLILSADTVGLAAPVSLWYDIQLTDGMGNISTPISGVFAVSQSITTAPSGTAFGSTYTYDLNSAVGQVRMYIDDRDMSRVDAGIPLEQRSAIFSNPEIQVFLNNNVQDVMYAAAQALITISGNRQLLVQSRRIGKTAVDYGQVRISLQAQAAALIRMSNMKPADALAEISYTDANFRMILINAQLRNSS